MNRKSIRILLVALCLLFLIVGFYFLGVRDTFWMVFFLAAGFGCGAGVGLLNYSVYPEKYYPQGMSGEQIHADNPFLIKGRKRRLIMWSILLFLALLLLFLFFSL